MSRTSNPKASEFSEFIRSRRAELQISLLELERRTGFHNSRLSRWERGIEMPDRADRIAKLAKGLELAPADLYVAAGIDLIDQQPSHRLYLRSKYHQLPADALNDFAAYAERVISEHGIASGPEHGEDEVEPAA